MSYEDRALTDREYNEYKATISYLLDEYRKGSSSELREKFRKIIAELRLNYRQNRDTEYLIGMITDKVSVNLD